MMLISIVLFVLYRMVGGMVANIITQCHGVDDRATFINAVRVDLRSPCNMHVLERYARVFPLGYDSGLKNDSDACFRSEIITDSAGDRGYLIAMNSQYCGAVQKTSTNTLEAKAIRHCKYDREESCSSEETISI